MTVNSNPLISIITPCLNRAKYISQAVESVLHQDYALVEHIIVDGGSMDGTLEILMQYPHLRIISEPDQGIYDALNKGLQLARGEIIGHLNTDDLYEPNIFSSVIAKLVSCPELDAVVGAATIFETLPDGETIRVIDYPPVEEGELLQRTTKSVPAFNAWFFRKQIMDQVGGFNPEYRIAGDNDLMLRMHLIGIHFASVNQLFYHYRMHSGSITINHDSFQWAKAEKEIMIISESYLRGDVSEEVKYYCKLWHTRAAENVFRSEFGRKRWLTAAQALWQGGKYDPSWLFQLFWRKTPFGRFSTLQRT